MPQLKSESSIHCILSACSFDLNISNTHQAISYIRYIVTSFIKTIEQYINDTVYDIISGIDWTREEELLWFYNLWCWSS